MKDEIDSLKSLIKVTNIEDPPNMAFVLVHDSKHSTSTTKALKIEAYVNMDVLPKDLKDAVRAFLRTTSEGSKLKDPLLDQPHAMSDSERALISSVSEALYNDERTTKE